VTVLGPEDPADGVLGDGHGACTPTTDQDETPPAVNTTKDLSGGSDPVMANSPLLGKRAWAYFKRGDGPVVTLADPQDTTGVSAEVYSSWDYEGQIYYVLDAPDGSFWEAWEERNNLGADLDSYTEVSDKNPYLVWTHYTASGANITDTAADTQQSGSIQDLATRIGATSGRVGWILSCNTEDTDVLMGIDALKVTTTSGTTTYDLEAPSEQADLSRTQSYGYDAAGNQTSMTDALGNTWSKTYDARDQLVATTDPAVPITTIAGARTSQPRMAFGYDAMGDQTRQTDGDGDSTYTTYDDDGDQLAVTEPSTAGQTTVGARTWTTTYNAAGLPTSESEPDGVQLTMAYDNLGDLTSQVGTTNGRQDATRTLTYDAAGRITSFNEPGGKATVAWDNLGLPISVEHANGQTDTASYNSLGLPYSTTDASGTLTYLYNTSSDLAQVTDQSTGSVYAFGYDKAGRPTSQATYAGVDSSGTPTGMRATQTWSYDPFGRVTAQSYANGSGSATGSLSYTWNLDDEMTSQATSGALLGAGKPANDTVDYAYDAAGRLTSSYDVTAGTGTDYGWDAAGNRTLVIPWTGTPAGKTNGPAQQYIYDERNRLTSAFGPTGTTSYGYDQRGDRTSAALNDSITATEGFDAFGRMTSDTSQGSHAMTYDGLDRMIGEAGGQTLTYSALGRDPVSSGDWALLRLPDGKALAERGPPGTLDDLVSNVHGDVVAKLGPAGGAGTSRSYDPFGDVTSSGSLGAPIGFQGSLTDPTTGQVHADARWYDPSTGQFDSQDTAPPSPTTVASANLYGYGNANPVTYSDPTGHSWLSALGGALLGVGEDLGLGACIATIECGIALGVGAVVVGGAGYLGYREYQEWTDPGNYWPADDSTTAPPADYAGTTTATSTTTASTGTAARPTRASTSAASSAAAEPTLVCPAGYALTPQKTCVSTAPPPPMITGTKSWTTYSTPSTHVRRWSDGKNDYLQTITKVTSVQHTANTWSNGNKTYATGKPQTSTTRSKVTTIPLVDLDHPLSFPVVTAPVPATPFAGNGTVASDTGVCGNGGSLKSCPSYAQAALPGDPGQMAQQAGIPDAAAGNATPPEDPSDEDDKCESGAPNNGQQFYRGAKGGDQPSFEPRANEFKVDPETGLVRGTHGVSVFDNPDSVSSKGFTPHQIDPCSVPDELDIIQRGQDPSHYEIVPREGAGLTPDEFGACLSQIECF
jgi:RHS repeat-associated protein